MKVDICGIKVDNITMIEAVAAIRSKYGTGERFIVVTPNAEIIEESAKNPEVAEILNSADMAVPDGVGVIYASRILKQPIAERVTGVDLAYNLAEDMSKHGASLFILGGEPGVAELAAVNITKKYPGLKIAGTHDGFYKEESGVIDIINASGADVLYISMGAPRQEFFMHRNKDKLKVSAMLGLGGTVNDFAGTVKRAPKIFIKLRLEWLYRTVKLKRFKRMMKLPKFMWRVIKYKKHVKKRG